MMGLIWYIIAAWVIVCVILVYVEVKKAPVIDERKPFLHDDYDEDLDPTKKYMSVFCQHCAKNLDGYCNNGKYFRKIGDEMVEICKKEEYFEVK